LAAGYHHPIPIYIRCNETVKAEASENVPELTFALSEKPKNIKAAAPPKAEAPLSCWRSFLQKRKLRFRVGGLFHKSGSSAFVLEIFFIKADTPHLFKIIKAAACPQKIMGINIQVMK
jgi:hypothetical protein